MSEYQHILFRAIDRPVDAKNLTYMRQQSTRADITPLSFENVYEFGDFRGDAEEMLRRGYDLHLHYANFGIRKLLIRLPNGLPAPLAWKNYSAEDSLTFIKDGDGPGGCLAINPYFEAGEQEDLWDLPELMDRLVPLREELLNGDLRPLYLAHLGVACDDNHDPETTCEAPVPAGLATLTAAQTALAELYALDANLIAAASQESLPLPRGERGETQYAAWVVEQNETIKNAWLTALLSNDEASIRAEILAQYRADRDAVLWQTTEPNRTIAQLLETADRIKRQGHARDAAKAARQRTKALSAMAADPNQVLRETEKLVAERMTKSYRKASELLAELRAALAGTDRHHLAEQQAQKLRAANPSLRLLNTELRRQGFEKH